MGILHNMVNTVQWALIRSGAAWERFEGGECCVPLTAEQVADPYPVYRKLRETDPVHRSGLVGGYFVSRYEDVLAVLQDKRFSADDRQLRHGQRMLIRKLNAMAGLATKPVDAQTMLRLDPPQHDQIRNQIQGGFSHRSVKSVQLAMERRAEELLDAAEVSGRLDVLNEFAAPLAFEGMANIFGICGKERERWNPQWASDYLLNFAVPTVVNAKLAEKAQRELQVYSDWLLRRREPQTGKDLLSRLALAARHNPDMSWKVMVSLCELVFSGHDIAKYAVGNSLLSLFKHSDQMELLRREPELVENAVEELLRYESPIQATSRVAQELVELRGCHIRPGMQVLVGLGSANRDPEQFSHPDRLDISRDNVDHLAFGHGVHYCLGSQLARMVTRISLSTFLKRFPKPQLDQTNVSWIPYSAIRGPQSLVVKCC